MIDSIRADSLSIGFCCQRYASDPITRKEIRGIKVVPLDCNSDGILEDRERFYNDLDALQRAMQLGKYPCHSYQNYYIIARESPGDQYQIEFIRYMLTEGKKKIHEAGYVNLRPGYIPMELEILNRLRDPGRFSIP